MTDVRNWIEPLRENGMPRLAAILEEQCDLVDRLQEAVGVPLSAADTAAIESTVDALFKEHTPMANHTNKGEIMRYRKKPVVIEATRWTGDNVEEMLDFVSTDSATITADFDIDQIPDEDTPLLGSLSIPTLEGVMTASVGDWVIKEPFPTDDRQFYPCKPDIFEATYEAVPDD